MAHEHRSKGDERGRREWISARLVGWTLLAAGQLAALGAALFPTSPHARGLLIASPLLGLPGKALVAVGFERLVQRHHHAAPGEG